jgi:uncharacterized LabA/DUF88 family protein
MRSVRRREYTHGFFLESRSVERTICFIDGFNLYHAINDLKKPHLKWLDLSRLASVFVGPKQELVEVVYFSAFPTWIPASYRRHKVYVQALTAVGVRVEMSSFFQKERTCRADCKKTYVGYEEKQSDVKLAIWMFDYAFRGRFDRALLVTGDSDLAPAVSMIRTRFKDKKIVVISPPGRKLTYELAQCVDQKNKKNIKLQHLEKCLFPKEVKDREGNIVAIRPKDYDPPEPEKHATINDLKTKFNSL